MAAGLAGAYCQNYQFPAWQKALLNLLGRFPQGLARAVISRFEALSGLDPARLDGLQIETLARERLRDYAGLKGPFPAITLGAALGGASAHLALALGGPFLPQAFVTTLRGGAPDGDPQVYLQRSLERARSIARMNPEVLTIQHYDPVHDGWMTRHVNHLRFKLLDLPGVYREYLQQHLEPGGAVVYLNCGARWLRYRLDSRSVFQVGGWGNISPREFISGSPRLQAYARTTGLSRSDWSLSGYPLEEGPESEWGCEPGLGSALEAFCHKQGYRFIEIALPHPHDYSRLAFFCPAGLAGRSRSGTRRNPDRDVQPVRRQRRSKSWFAAALADFQHPRQPGVSGIDASPSRTAPAGLFFAPGHFFDHPRSGPLGQLDEGPAGAGLAQYRRSAFPLPRRRPGIDQLVRTAAPLGR